MISLHLFEDCSSFKWGPDLTFLLRNKVFGSSFEMCPFGQTMVTRKRTGTDVEIVTSLTLYLILQSKKDCIYQDKFHFTLDGPYSAGK